MGGSVAKKFSERGYSIAAMCRKESLFEPTKTILEKAKSYQDEDDFTVNVEPGDNTTSGKIETELFRTVQPKASKKLFPFAISGSLLCAWPETARWLSCLLD